MQRRPKTTRFRPLGATDLPIELPAAESDAPKGQAPIGTMTTTALWQRTKTGGGLDARWAGLEFHRRLALPTACLMLALVGIPLGLSAKKGGKSSGFVITIILVFAYYSLSLIGVSLAKEDKVPVILGAWLADLDCLVGGVCVLLYRGGEAAHRHGRAPPLLGTDEGTPCGLRHHLAMPCAKRPPAPTAGRSSVRACLA